MRESAMLTALSDSGTVNLDRLATFTAELVQRGLNVTVVSGDDESYVFGNRVAGSELDRAYQGRREPDHRTSE
jgi:hypothetical protein